MLMPDTELGELVISGKPGIVTIFPNVQPIPQVPEVDGKVCGKNTVGGKEQTLLRFHRAEEQPDLIASMRQQRGLPQESHQV